MAGVAKAWEAAVTQTAADRVVWLRTAVVLQSHSPALDRLTKITRRFLGGTVSHGRQWVSWIHITDYLRALDFVIAGKNLSGIIHVCSPRPITNRALMTALRKALHRPWMPPTPAVLIKLGAWLLFKTDPALALTGRRAVPKVLNDAGFEFQFSEIDQALRDLCR
jgi:NAD dependent epimerase/dehydratase family enzyme